MLFVKLNFHSIVNIADIASEFSDAEFIVLYMEQTPLVWFMNTEAVGRSALK